MDQECENCRGLGWVCENHPSQPWSSREGCQCGAGMPCECTRLPETGAENTWSAITGDGDLPH